MASEQFNAKPTKRTIFLQEYNYTLINPEINKKILVPNQKKSLADPLATYLVGKIQSKI